MSRIFIDTDRPKDFLETWVKTAQSVGYSEINRISAPGCGSVSVNLFHGKMLGLETVQLIFTTIVDRNDTLICDMIDDHQLSPARIAEIERRMIDPLMYAYGNAANAIVGMSDGKKSDSTTIILGR
jgi:hypothetical protein